MGGLVQWFRSPKRLTALFLAVACTLAGTLGWLGWRLLDQDAALAQQRIQERLETAADLVAATLLNTLSRGDDQLSMLAALPDSQLASAVSAYADPFSEALAVVSWPGSLEAYPAYRLLYLPVQPESEEPDGAVFAAGEGFEFRKKNYTRAVSTFRQLARTKDDAIRAGALLRLARNLRKAGKLPDALEVYAELIPMGAILLGGVPVELLARHARCTVLAELEQPSALEHEARDLYQALNEGRLPVTRAAYQFYTRETRAWLNGSPNGAEAAPLFDRPSDHALAAGTAALWDLWERIRRGDEAASGRRSLWLHERPIFLVWRSTPDRLVGLVAGQEYFDQQWLGDLAPLLQRQNVRIALTDAAGHAILTQLDGEAEQQAVRTAAETRLPWTLHVTSANAESDLAEGATRRRLLLAGLILVGIVVLGSLYFTGRAVTRELAVARLQSDFVSAVSHEFRTPLTSLRQLTEMLAGGRVVSEDRRRKYYQVLMNESQRLHRLVEDLLDFGRIEAGVLTYSREQVDAIELVRDVVARFQEEMAHRPVRIDLHAHASTCPIQGDPEALCRALWNLLDNAVKYAPDSDTVRVTTERIDGRLAIRVRDDGPGIPTDEQEQIFKKFVRGANAQASSAKGTGLGLTMVRHIAQHHGGDIDLESEPSQGSTFTLFLPIAE